MTAPTADPGPSGRGSGRQRGAGSEPEREPGPASASPEAPAPAPAHMAAPAPPGRSRRYLILPGALALAGIAAADAAFALDAKPVSSAIGADAATTPCMAFRHPALVEG